MKICSKCGIEKELEEFHKDKQKKDGLCSKCKNCTIDRQKEYYKENKEQSKEYYQVNKEEIKQQKKEYYKKNIEEIIKQIKKYQKENRLKINQQLRERYKNDPIYRLECNLRNRIRYAIKNGTKSASTLKLLGCSIEEVRNHLEKQFTEGMNWDNYNFNGWHVDHIRPCASFDLTDPEQQRECFNWSNLQPMWAKKNWSKNSFFNGIRH